MERIDRAKPPAARQRPRPDARICGGRVDEGVAPPHPSQSRMCRFPASGSSWESLAHGRVDDTIRDSLAEKVTRVPSRFRSRQFSYPLSLRGQVCEAQGPLPCFPSTVLSTWHPAFLDRVPVSPVPRCHWYYQGATTSRHACPVTYLLRFRGPRDPPRFVSRSLRSRSIGGSARPGSLFNR
jgi:hypothetical protein